jgi:hypothetical protein
MDHEKAGLQGVAWIDLAQNINQLQDFVQVSREREFRVKMLNFFAYHKRTI